MLTLFADVGNISKRACFGLVEIHVNHIQPLCVCDQIFIVVAMACCSCYNGIRFLLLTTPLEPQLEKFKHKALKFHTVSSCIILIDLNEKHNLYNTSVSLWTTLFLRGAPFIKSICHMCLTTSNKYPDVWFLSGPKKAKINFISKNRKYP